ncbi:APH(3') family aminoglycoside O-phosphotransferase [Nocardia sp. NPDC005978]|uniref:APH(3') family aminoglycoside O-phosphotransferase n=1 Tax=Nocardia sp. NPDC005978 TaxID=3156725 RepID=UPI0033B66A54
MGDWEVVTVGCSDAVVRRSADGSRFDKTATTAAARAELVDERDRLLWLESIGVGAPRVLDWRAGEGGATLVSSTLAGIPASDVPGDRAAAVVEALVEFSRTLHALPIGECPFDRTLAVTVPAAAANVAAGLVDEDDFDGERAGFTAAELLGELEVDRARAEVLEAADLVVCHGDFCLPNVLLDPQTLTVTGILDVGRLGIADRHLDLALLTRSVADPDLNPAYGAELAEWVADRTGADPWRLDYYRLLDEFF